MSNKKNPNQKGSGAKKHRRNYRLRNQEHITTGVVTRYRARHGIPEGRRKALHAEGRCPRHGRIG